MKEPSFPIPLSLQKIKTWNSAVPRVSSWVGSLVNLQQLCFQVGRIGQEDLCILGGLRALLIMDLQQVRKISGDKRFTVSGAVGFRCLRQFFYHTYDRMDLVFEVGSMPKLEKLVIILDGVVEADTLDIGIGNLPCLLTIKCVVHGDDGIVGAIKIPMERAVTRHPNHPTLLFTH